MAMTPLLRLPPVLSWFPLFVSGQLHAYNVLQPSALNLPRHLSNAEYDLDAFVRYAPFAATLSLQTHLMELAKDNKGPVPWLAKVFEGPPGANGKSPATYPFVRVALRAAAQQGASAFGAWGSLAFLASAVGKEVDLAREGEEPARPLDATAFLVAATVFGATALMGMPVTRNWVAKNLGATVAKHLMDIAVPTACVVNDAVYQQVRGRSAEGGGAGSGKGDLRDQAAQCEPVQQQPESAAEPAQSEAAKPVQSQAPQPAADKPPQEAPRESLPIDQLIPPDA
jgi:hypothetical protein